MAGIRKPVYFNSQLEQDLIDWCEQFSNFSMYVKQLIRNDIRREQEGIDPKILEFIEKKLEGMTLVKEDETQPIKIDLSDLLIEN